MKHTRFTASILAVAVAGGIMVQAVMASPARAADLSVGQAGSSHVPHPRVDSGRPVVSQ